LLAFPLLFWPTVAGLTRGNLRHHCRCVVQVNVRGVAAGAWMNDDIEVVSMVVQTAVASTFVGTEDGSAVVAVIGSMNIVVDDADLLPNGAASANNDDGAVAAGVGPDGG